jgi:hypothetical protein
MRCQQSGTAGRAGVRTTLQAFQSPAGVCEQGEEGGVGAQAGRVQVRCTLWTSVGQGAVGVSSPRISASLLSSSSVMA